MSIPSPTMGLPGTRTARALLSSRLRWLVRNKVCICRLPLGHAPLLASPSPTSRPERGNHMLPARSNDPTTLSLGCRRTSLPPPTTATGLVADQGGRPTVLLQRVTDVHPPTAGGSRKVDQLMKTTGDRLGAADPGDHPADQGDHPTEVETALGVRDTWDLPVFTVIHSIALSRKPTR